MIVWNSDISIISRTCPRGCFSVSRTLAAGLDAAFEAWDEASTRASFLKEAIRAVPAVKYAMGVGGVAAVVAIVAGLKIDYRVAVFGTVILVPLEVKTCRLSPGL